MQIVNFDKDGNANVFIVVTYPTGIKELITAIVPKGQLETYLRFCEGREEK